MSHPKIIVDLGGEGWSPHIQVQHRRMVFQDPFSPWDPHLPIAVTRSPRSEVTMISWGFSSICGGISPDSWETF